MEIVIVSKNRVVGIGEEDSGLSDIDYFSSLPNYSECLGLISKKSFDMLTAHRIEQVRRNIITEIKIKKGNIFMSQSEHFYLYSIKNIDPVLYEVIGFNCILNLKGNNYDSIVSLKNYFFKDFDFTKNDFEQLEYYTNYLICSYYEGEASHIYTSDIMANQIIENFDELYFRKIGSKLRVEELS